MITQWHYKVAEKFATLNHGKVNELRRSKASISTLTGVEHWTYYSMEAWLIARGHDVEPEHEPRLPATGLASMRHVRACQRAIRAAGGLL